MIEWIVRKGTPADAGGITALTNQAYSGRSDDGETAGWTNEIHLVEGPRTSVGEILQRMESGIFLCAFENEPGPVRGSVFFEPHDNDCYIGMLAVAPTLQNSGLGRTLMKNCEALARDMGIPQLTLTVLSPRTELQAWYERQGFQPTGERLPFPHGGPFDLIVYRKLTPTS